MKKLNELESIIQQREKIQRENEFALKSAMKKIWEEILRVLICC